MGKHFNSRTKKTYSKYSKPESKKEFRQRLKKPCPKFEDLFIDKDVGENIFVSPPSLQEPIGATMISPNLKNDFNSFFLSSGNDTFDAIANSKIFRNNAQNFTIKPKSIIKSPEFLSTTPITTSGSSIDDMFLSALQSPANCVPSFSTPSKFNRENKFSLHNNDLLKKESSNVIISTLKEESPEQNKNLTTCTIFNVVTSTPTFNAKAKCLKKMGILKNEFSPVDKNTSYNFIEDSYVSESDVQLLNVPSAPKATVEMSASKNIIDTMKKLDLNHGLEVGCESLANGSSDIVYSDEDVFLSNTFSNILSLKPTTFFRVTRRRKFVGNCNGANEEKFFYSSKISLPNHSRFDTSSKATRNLSKKISRERNQVSSSHLEKNNISNVSALSISISKGGKGWRRSVKKISASIANQSFKINLSRFQEDDDEIKAKSFQEEDYKEKILQLCNQNEELSISKCFNKSMMEKCKKIGEGLFGEVFLLNFDEKSDRDVLKLMPIEGELKVNGECQKSFEQMLPELIISKYLSDLYEENCENFCPSFVKLKKCLCLKGSYTAQMLKLWDDYANSKESENDRPDFLPVDQIHLALQFEFAGQDLEAYVFNNGMQAYSIFLQIAYALCVAELELEFEHRDMHWGNILISQTSETLIIFKVKGNLLKIKTSGVKCKIIDFTLSRLSSGSSIYFNDLSLDPDLFTASGDYQFDIYRMMRDNNKNEWKTFNPKSNIFWLHYVILKMKDECYYKNKSSKIHKQGLKEMASTCNSILKYNSASDFVCCLENIS